MGGGGGTSGAVEFPAYMEDTHGLLLIGETVNNANEYTGNTGSITNAPSLNLFSSVDTASSNNPYSSAYSGPAVTTEFDFETNFNAFTSAYTSYGTASISELLSASLQVADAATSSIRDIILDFSTNQLDLPTATTGINNPNLQLRNLGLSVGSPSLGLPSTTLSTSTLSLSYPTISLDVSTHDIDSSITAVQELLTSIATLDLTAPTTRYNDFISEAEQTLANSTGVAEADYSNVISRADTEAQTLIASIFALVKSNGIEMLQVSKDEFISFVDVNLSEPTTVLSNATGLAQGFLDSKHSAPTTLMNQAISLSSSMVTTNLSSTTKPFSDAVDLSKNASSEAISFAEDLSLRSEISNLVTSFSSRREVQRQQQLSQFNAQMAGGNAVHSSAFMFGQALIYAEQQKEEAQFNAELVKQAFDRGLQLYQQSLQTATQSAVQTYGVNQELYQRAFVEAVKAFLQGYTVNTEGWTQQASQVVSAYVETYARNLVAYQQGFQTVSQVFAQYITSGFESSLTGQSLQSSTALEQLDISQQNELLAQAAQLMFQLESENIVNADPAMAAFSQIYTGLFNARLRANITQEELSLQAKQTQIGQEEFNLSRETLSKQLGLDTAQLTLEEYIAEVEKAAQEENLQVQSEQLRLEAFRARLERAIQEKQIALENAATTLRQKALELDQQSRNKQGEEQRFSSAYQSALQLLTNKVEFERIAAEMRTEQNKLTYSAKREEFQDELEYNAADALWDLQILDKSVRLLAAPSGMSAALPEKPSKASQVIGGALKGGGTGAAIGSVVPGVGTAIGAGVGAGLGALSGLFS